MTVIHFNTILVAQTKTIPYKMKTSLLTVFTYKVDYFYEYLQLDYL